MVKNFPTTQQNVSLTQLCPSMVRNPHDSLYIGCGLKSIQTNVSLSDSKFQVCDRFRTLIYFDLQRRGGKLAKKRFIHFFSISNPTLAIGSVKQVYNMSRSR